MLRERLERWQRAPDPVLADLIDITPTESPVWKGSGATRRAAALASIEARELHALGAVFVELQRTRSAKAAVVLAKALDDHWPADPRLTTRVLTLLEQAPWVGQTSLKVWRRLFRALQRTPDVRQQRFAHLDVRSIFPGASHEVMERRVHDLLQLRAFPTRAATAGEIAVWRAELEAHAERQARTARRRAEVVELLERYRDSGERELLFVLADAWQQLGEPRGDYLALCLRQGLDKQGRRARDRLLKAHERDWLGPLQAITTAKGRVWRDGFLREARLFVKNRASYQAAAGHPAWWQVEHLVFGGITGMQDRPFEVVGSPDLPNLRAVGGLVSLGELHVVLRHPAIRQVQLTRPPWDLGVGRAGWRTGSYTLDKVVMHASWASVASVLVDSLQVDEVLVELDGAEPGDHQHLMNALATLRDWAPLTFRGPGKERYQAETPSAHTG